MQKIKPYTDDFMRWDEVQKRYFLTEKALISHGLDLRGRLAQTRSVDPTLMIESIVRNITNTVYNYIHAHNDSGTLDNIIATHESARKVLFTALCDQALYVGALGDQAFSMDESKIRLMLSPHARNTINNTDLPEYGVPLTYTGVWYCV
jgi:hypothetical protein